MKFRHLSPFDTAWSWERVRLGRSQSLYYQLDFEHGMRDQALYQVFAFPFENKDTELVFEPCC